MAEDLGVSPSYLNHLERNQRPVTAQVLLRLAETYDIDIRSSVRRRGRRRRAGPRRSVRRPDVPRSRPSRATRSPRWPRTRRASPTPSCGSTAPSPTAGDLADVGAPRAPRTAGRPDGHAVGLGARLHPGASATSSPNWTRSARRWPPRWTPSRRASPPPPRQRLAERHGIQVRIAPDGGAARSAAPLRPPPPPADAVGAAGRRRAAPSPSPTSWPCWSTTPDIAALVERAAPPDGPPRRLLKVSLANYLAAGDR